MATNIVFCISLCIFIFSMDKAYATTERKPNVKNDFVHSHFTIHVSSLLPSSECNPSPKAIDRNSSVQVVHKHGPCSKLKNIETPTHREMLLRDQARVDSIHSRFSQKLGQEETDGVADLVAKDGNTIGSANYIVTVGLGNPKKELSLVFDTGSDLTWTQCQPCVGSCYDQQEQIFDPSYSQSYYNVTCSSESCRSLGSATGNNLKCSSSTCVYGIQYGDSSFSVGFFAQEKLTLTSTNVFDNFLFGCGQNNQGLFAGSAGLIGLGRDKLSLPSQTASKFNKLFSYCLPSSPSSTGHLTFGTTVSKSIKYTPFSRKISQESSFYGLDIVAISVGGKRLMVSFSSLSSNAGTVIDSGTVVTRLPSTVYAELRTYFRRQMIKYKRAPALSILDTCYDFSKYKVIVTPRIVFFFAGGAEVDIDATGIFYANKLSQVCLAFVGNEDDSSVAIFGNTQQKTLEVVYDGVGERVGFAPRGCE